MNSLHNVVFEFDFSICLHDKECSGVGILFEALLSDYKFLAAFASSIRKSWFEVECIFLNSRCA
jgi:hypothetical protein